MSDTEPAIVVSGVYKNFKLPHQKKNSIKSFFTEMFNTNNSQTEVQHALKGVSFEIKQGDFFGIVGRNGSGKSTLLKMLAGIYQPTKGNISVKGKLVPFIELGVGFNPELSGRQNVYLNGALLGFGRKEIDAMYQDIVEFAELEQFMDQKLKNYSSGMQVRLAFSMAIRADADILLIDEVLAVGDADFQRKCFEYFAKLKRNNKTVVFVSHDMDAVKDYCNRAVLISEGKVLADGEPEKVAEEYLKQFSKPSQSSGPSNQQKWGSQDVVHEDVQVSLEKNEIKIMVTAKVKSQNPELLEAVFGFVVKNSAGLTLLGSNTYLMNQKISLNKVGQRIKLVWTVPDIFGDGEYFVDVAAHHKAGAPVYEWWERSAAFTIKKQRHSHYPVTPNYKLNIQTTV